MMGIINQLSEVKPSWLRSLGWACLNFPVKLSRDTELKKPVGMQLTKWLGFNKITIWLEHHWKNWNIIILRLFYDLMIIYDYWHNNQLVKSIMILIMFLWLFQWYPMESGWWFGTWMDYDFPFSWEAHNPNWRSPSFFRGVETNHQPGITMNHGLESDL